MFKGLKSKNIKIAILSNGTPNLLKGLVESNNIKIILMIFFLLNLLEFTNLIQEFMKCQLKITAVNLKIFVL